MKKNKANIVCLVFLCRFTLVKSKNVDIIHMMLKREEGFTLVELMVVLFILGILMIAAIPTYLGARNRAFRNVAEQYLTNSARAAAAYYTQYQFLPDADKMEQELPSYEYVDSTTAVAAERPPKISVDNTNNYHMVNMGDSAGTVVKIDVSDGNVGVTTTGNP